MCGGDITVSRVDNYEKNGGITMQTRKKEWLNRQQNEKKKRGNRRKSPFHGGRKKNLRQNCTSNRSEYSTEKCNSGVEGSQHAISPIRFRNKGKGKRSEGSFTHLGGEFRGGNLQEPGEVARRRRDAILTISKKKGGQYDFSTRIKKTNANVIQRNALSMLERGLPRKTSHPHRWMMGKKIGGRQPQTFPRGKRETSRSWFNGGKGVGGGAL